MTTIEIIIISTIIPPTICEDNIKTKNAPIDMYAFLLNFNPKLPRLFCNAESFLKSPFLNFFLK